MVNAFAVRFYLMSNPSDLDKAFDHATLVNLSVRSSSFDAVNQNSIAATGVF
jgi:hypothetical protein